MLLPNPIHPEATEASQVIVIVV